MGTKNKATLNVVMNPGVAGEKEVFKIAFSVDGEMSTGKLRKILTLCIEQLDAKTKKDVEAKAKRKASDYVYKAKVKKEEIAKAEAKAKAEEDKRIIEAAKAARESIEAPGISFDLGGVPLKQPTPEQAKAKEDRENKVNNLLIGVRTSGFMVGKYEVLGDVLSVALHVESKKVAVIKQRLSDSAIWFNIEGNVNEYVSNDSWCETLGLIKQVLIKNGKIEARGISHEETEELTKLASEFGNTFSYVESEFGNYKFTDRQGNIIRFKTYTSVIEYFDKLAELRETESETITELENSNVSEFMALFSDMARQFGFNIGIRDYARGVIGLQLFWDKQPTMQAVGVVNIHGEFKGEHVSITGFTTNATNAINHIKHEYYEEALECLADWAKQRK